MEPSWSVNMSQSIARVLSVLYFSRYVMLLMYMSYSYCGSSRGCCCLLSPLLEEITANLSATGWWRYQNLYKLRFLQVLPINRCSHEGYEQRLSSISSTFVDGYLLSVLLCLLLFSIATVRTNVVALVFVVFPPRETLMKVEQAHMMPETVQGLTVHGRQVK